MLRLKYFSKTISKSFFYRFSQSTVLEEVEGKVFQVLQSASKCKIEKVSLTASFQELGFDSLDSVELIVAMEEHFGFFITDEEAEKIETVGDTIAIFNKYMIDIRSKELLQVVEEPEGRNNS